MDKYELTKAQKRIIYTEQIYSEPRISNEGGYYKISSPFNLYRMVDAIINVINSSRIFKTVFVTQNEEIIQTYRDCTFDTTAVNIFFDKNSFESFTKKSLDSEFNIYSDCLFRFALYQDNTGGQLFVMFHHSIVDAYSIGLIAGAIFDIYNGKKTKVGTDYITYLEEELDYLNSKDEYERDRAYWEERFNKYVIEFENAPETTLSDNLLFRLSNNYLKQWDSFLKKYNLNENMFLITLICIYRYRLINNKTGVLGIPYYNRRNKEFFKTFGMFTSTVPFLYSLTNQATILDVYREVKRSLLKDIKHSKYPYNDLINTLKANGKNLFEWSFNYYVDNMNYLVEGSSVTVKEVTPKHLPIPLNIIYRRFRGQKNEIELVFNKECYSREEIYILLKNFISFVINIVSSDITEKISNIQIAKHDLIENIKLNEKRSLESFNSRLVTPLFDRVKNIAERYPNNVALRLNDSTITYEQLIELVEERVDLLSDYLKSDDVVGVIGFKEFETIINIIALVKMGITYVPIDPEYPEKRQRFILSDANCSWYLSHSDIIINSSYKTNSNSNLSKPLYILYTSGTTGTPKGVMVPEIGIIRMLEDSKLNKLSCGYETFLQLNSLGFDISELEIWFPLTNGKTLEIIPKDYIFETDKLLNILSVNRKYGSIMSFTLLQELFSYSSDIFRNFKFIITGGEIVKKKLIGDIYNSTKSVVIANGYGPTENSVLSTIEIINEQNKEQISIGSSIAGSSTYVLDKFGKVCAPMQIGEIVVGGSGVAIGYLNQKEQNERNFFYSNSLNGEKLYHTGDFGYYTKELEIIILGRRDTQVKINGQRIEVSEIEDVIQKILNSTDTKIAVDVIKNTVVCFYTGDKIDEFKLKERLREVLTSVMIPKYFLNISDIPLTINGKMDRKKLTELFQTRLSKNNGKTNMNLDNLNIEIQNELKKLLNTEINYDNSFIENGGDSLTAMKLVNRMKKLKRIIKVTDLLSHKPLVEVFNKTDAINSELEIVKNSGLQSVKASEIQKGIYFDEKFMHVKYKYNSPMVFELQGANISNENRILKEINKFISSQRLLRSNFKMENGEILFQHSDRNFYIEHIDLDSVSLNDAIKASLTDFDVEKCLFCCKYLKWQNRKFLVFDFHHAIFDGTSRKIFTQKLQKYLNNPNYSLSTSLDYFDYLNSHYKNNNVERVIEDFWETEIKNLGHISDYYPRNSNELNSKYYPLEISQKLKDKIVQTSRLKSVTVSTILLTAFLLTRRKLLKSTVDTVGITISTRLSEDVSEIVGPFFNILPLSISSKENIDYTSYIIDVGEKVKELVNHSQFPFYKIDAMYKVYCGEYANVLMDWMYVFNNDENLDFKVDDIEFIQKSILDTVNAKYKLSLLVNYSENTNLNIGFECQSESYNGKSIYDIICEFKEILCELLEHVE